MPLSESLMQSFLSASLASRPFLTSRGAGAPLNTCHLSRNLRARPYRAKYVPAEISNEIRGYAFCWVSTRVKSRMTHGDFPQYVRSVRGTVLAGEKAAPGLRYGSWCNRLIRARDHKSSSDRVVEGSLLDWLFHIEHPPVDQKLLLLLPNLIERNEECGKEF